MPFLLIRFSWFLTHSLSQGSVVPCGSSSDTSVLVQSLDSLRTSRHGHLLANRHRCRAGKGLCSWKSRGRSAGQERVGRGWDLLPKDVIPPQSWGMVVKLYSRGRFDDVNIGSWSFLGFLFFLFFCLGLSRWQIPWGWMAIILQEETRREEEHILLGTRESMLVEATEYKESFNHKKMKLYVQMQSVGLVPPSPFFAQ